MDARNTETRVVAPSYLVRGMLVLMGALLWPIQLLIITSIGLVGAGQYMASAVGLAGMHMICGFLFRSAARQGLWVSPYGDLTLCSPYGELRLIRGTVDRVALDRGLGAAYVWSGGRVWWLETGSRLGASRMADQALADAASAISQAALCPVGPLEDVETLRGQAISSLEFSLRGFSRVVRSPLVWIPVLVGQLALLASVA